MARDMRTFSHIGLFASSGGHGEARGNTGMGFSIHGMS